MTLWPASRPLFRSRPFGLVALAALVAVGPCIPGSTAVAQTQQSDNDLRAENQALKTRVHDLELELAAARARATDLEKRLADSEAKLKAAAATAPPGTVGSGQVPPPQVPPTTIDENVMNASPTALLKALQADYAQVLGPAGGYATPKERTVYFRALEKWVAGANRRFRMPVEWLVRTEQVGSIGDKSAVLRVIAIDPGNGHELGDPFDVAVPIAMFRRAEAAGLTAKGREVVLRGTLNPALILSEKRETVGAFNKPKFIGPFAELGFGVDATSVTAGEPEQGRN